MSASPQKPPLKRPEIDLDTLQQQQLNAAAGHDDGPETRKGSADSSYELPKHEEHLLHVRFTRKVNNPLTKSYDEQVNTVALSAPEYERMEKNESFKEFDKVELLHDPRPKARKEADKTGDVPSATPAAAKKQIRSLQDAQMRYKELTGEDAPGDKSFTQLKEAIAHFEQEKGADKSTNADGSPLQEG